MSKRIVTLCLPLMLFWACVSSAMAGVVDDCDNFISSQQYAKAEAAGRQAVRQLGSFDAFICLGKALSKQGKCTEALPVLQSANDLARNDDQIGSAANWQGGCHSQLGNYDAALEQHNRELSIAKRQKNKNSEATALNNVALAYDNKGDRSRALQYFEEALRLQTIDTGKATVLNNIAMVHSANGDFKKAIAKLGEAVAIDRRAGNQHGLGMRLLNLGDIRRKNGDLEGASRDLAEGLTFVQQVGDKHWLATGYANIARLQEERNEAELARQSWLQAARLYQSIGDKAGAQWADKQGSRLSNAAGCEAFREAGKEAMAASIAEAALKKTNKDAAAWLCIGKTYHVAQNYGEASKAFSQAVRLSTDKAEKADALDWSSWAYRFSNDLAKAREVAVKAVSLAREIKAEPTEVSALSNLVEIERDDPKGDKRKFTDYCMELDVINGDFSVNGWVWQSCGRLTAAVEDWPATIRRYQKAANAYKNRKETFNEAAVRINLGWALRKGAANDQAKQELQEGLRLLAQVSPPLEAKKRAGWTRLAQGTLGKVAVATNNVSEAKERFSAALQAARIEEDVEEIDALTAELAKLDAPVTPLIRVEQSAKTNRTDDDSAVAAEATAPTKKQPGLFEALGKVLSGAGQVITNKKE